MEHNKNHSAAATPAICALCKRPIEGDEWQVEFRESHKRELLCNLCARPIMEFLSKNKLLAD